MATAEQESDSAYAELLDRERRISNVENAGMILYWDQQTKMPEGGTPARAKQLSALQSIGHELLTDERTGELLDELESEDLDDERAAVVREVRRKYDRAVSVPSDLVEKISETTSEAQPAWQRAKAEDEFETFAPYLERLRELHIERAEHIAPDEDPYEVMFEDGEPYLPLERVDEIFDELREGLVPLIEDIEENGADIAADAFAGTFDPADQEALCRDALDLLNYDWDRGRLDIAPHPFMSGTQFDARVTTRFHEDEFVDPIFSTIHEFGHATYQLGLRDDAYGTPLGQSRSSGIHESQSRFWENHVGRTEAFWEFFLPTVTEHFPEFDDVTAEDAYEAANQVFTDNLIRVEADELTYHMHIILRSEIEQEFVAGDLDVDDIPARWNELMDEYLGVRPDTDSEGCLQDIHWTSGFASFQNYTVGSVFAAQLWATIEEELDDPMELIREGDFAPIRDWLTENIHEQGQKYTTDELIEEATGEPLTAEYFLDYATEKYGEIYELD
ncbi:Carboxypeptidase Taq [Haladaptatus paucihalophilus DX253]|uniref:Metal-dependent carboxypeptidase n=1 Tax=Haladaptatus paucihalophilus DX253 TaxID=797209 RepID=E7QU71_HALPU|nr:carboxypeptidase M32 [Haladaptatus paucihalophilus]EFW92150.1 Carboxypeptidase Taq [Haladaptatus paucihalophilus DX253]SHK90209.1 carboxypeptidase Taq [Haladaptatus paucihalophilus DX253]